MALFTSVMPSESGDNAQDIAALRAWACKLVSELRSLIYALDEQNVIKAREALKVAASGIEGVLSESQIPDIDISKVKGNRPYCIVEPGTDIATGFWIVKGETPLAHIYYEEYEEEGNDGGRLVIQGNDEGDIVIAGGTDVLMAFGQSETVLNQRLICNQDIKGGYIELKNGGDIDGVLNINGTVNITGSLKVNGNPVTGTVTITGE